jgi:hypothetical protein
MTKKKSTKYVVEGKQVYVAGLNLSGLWSTKPLKTHREMGSWWVSSGPLKDNAFAEKLGLDDRNGIITFASTSKRDVQSWIDGVLSSFKFLRNWTWIVDPHGQIVAESKKD